MKPTTYRFGVTLENGVTFSFELLRVPRYWKSWVMHQLPYGTSFLRAEWHGPKAA